MNNPTGVKFKRKRTWEALVSERKFQRIQEILLKNRFSRKSPSKSRYPYILSGLVNCAYCGDPLVGKSAHGNSGKVGYYAHGNKEKRPHCSSIEKFECTGRRRYPAKKLEPLVLEKVKELLWAYKTLYGVRKL